MERLRVRCTIPFAADDRAMLAAVDPRLAIVFGGPDTADAVAAIEDAEAEVLLSSWSPPDRAGMPRLRLLMTTNAGLDSLYALDPWSLGIVVTNGSGLHAVHIGEYVLWATLSAFGRTRARLAEQSAHRWPMGDARFPFAGRRLRGRTAAIVGYGSIGRECARLLDAFGMRVLALKADPASRVDHGWREPGTGDPEGRIPERLVGPDGLADIVAAADVVVLTAPLTPRTRHLVDARVLGLMRPDAWLVNVGRGGLVDESALIDALADERIGGAVLDVASEEPLPAASPLWSQPGAVLTPHVSAIGDFDMLLHQAALLFAEQLRRQLAGEPLLNVTSRAAGY